MYRADAHFRIGTSHEAGHSPCQDYALARNGASPLAVVSDGCSTSGRTDIGARVWALAAREGLSWFTAEKNRQEIIHRAAVSMRTLGLDIEDMDATLGYVAEVDPGYAVGFIVGDGILAARTAAGLDVTVIEWAGNMPGYPSYLLDGKRLAMFREQSHAAAGTGASPCRVTRTLFREDGSVVSTSVESLSATRGLMGIAMKWEDAEIAAALTDGAAQIPGVDLFTVANELLTIGSAREGFFIRRRLNAALKKFAKSGGRPADDISIAALVRVGGDV